MAPHIMPSTSASPVLTKKKTISSKMLMPVKTKQFDGPSSEPPTLEQLAGIAWEGNNNVSSVTATHPHPKSSSGAAAERRKKEKKQHRRPRSLELLTTLMRDDDIHDIPHATSTGVLPALAQPPFQHPNTTQQRRMLASSLTASGSGPMRRLSSSSSTATDDPPAEEEFKTEARLNVRRVRTLQLDSHDSASHLEDLQMHDELRQPKLPPLSQSSKSNSSKQQHHPRQRPQAQLRRSHDEILLETPSVDPILSELFSNSERWKPMRKQRHSSKHSQSSTSKQHEQSSSKHHVAPPQQAQQQQQTRRRSKSSDTASSVTPSFFERTDSYEMAPQLFNHHSDDSPLSKISSIVDPPSIGLLSNSNSLESKKSIMHKSSRHSKQKAPSQLSQSFTNSKHHYEQSSKHYHHAPPQQQKQTRRRSKSSDFTTNLALERAESPMPSAPKNTVHLPAPVFVDDDNKMPRRKGGKSKSLAARRRSKSSDMASFIAVSFLERVDSPLPMVPSTTSRPAKDYVSKSPQGIHQASSQASHVTNNQPRSKGVHAHPHPTAASNSSREEGKNSNNKKKKKRESSRRTLSPDPIQGYAVPSTKQHHQQQVQQQVQVKKSNKKKLFQHNDSMELEPSKYPSHNAKHNNNKPTEQLKSNNSSSNPSLAPKSSEWSNAAQLSSLDSLHMPYQINKDCTENGIDGDYPMKQQSINSDTSSDSIETVHTIDTDDDSSSSFDNNANATKTNLSQNSHTAEQLHDLIGMMQLEFQRLRSAKVNAEMKASTLETDLVSLQQERDAEFVSLSEEVERWKRVAQQEKVRYESVQANVDRLEDENTKIKMERSEARKGKSGVEERVKVLEDENRRLTRLLLKQQSHRDQSRRSDKGGHPSSVRGDRDDRSNVVLKEHHGSLDDTSSHDGSMTTSLLATKIMSKIGSPVSRHRYRTPDPPSSSMPPPPFDTAAFTLANSQQASSQQHPQSVHVRRRYNDRTVDIHPSSNKNSVPQAQAPASWHGGNKKKSIRRMPRIVPPLTNGTEPNTTVTNSTDCSTPPPISRSMIHPLRSPPPPFDTASSSSAHSEQASSQQHPQSAHFQRRYNDYTVDVRPPSNTNSVPQAPASWHGGNKKKSIRRMHRIVPPLTSGKETNTTSTTTSTDGSTSPPIVRSKVHLSRSSSHLERKSSSHSSSTTTTSSTFSMSRSSLGTFRDSAISSSMSREDEQHYRSSYQSLDGMVVLMEDLMREDEGDNTGIDGTDESTRSGPF